MNYKIKLDTNGTNPHLLAQLIDDGLIDYVAMDIKNAPDKYLSTAGCLHPNLDGVRESAALLMKGDLPFEFRTTLVPELHEPEDMDAIGSWLANAPRYFLQAYRESDQVLVPLFTEPGRDWMEMMRNRILPLIPSTQLRGID